MVLLPERSRLFSPQLPLIYLPVSARVVVADAARNAGPRMKECGVHEVASFNGQARAVGERLTCRQQSSKNPSDSEVFLPVSKSQVSDQMQRFVRLFP